MNSIVKSISKQLRQIQNQQLWACKPYEILLSRIHNDRYFERPIEGMHSVAEIISHLTFWRKDALVKIKTGRGQKKDNDPGNWRKNDVLLNIGWSQLKEDHDRTLEEFIQVLESKNDSFLKEEYFDIDFNGMYPYEFLINGILHHDLYHLGQLGLIVKFLKTKQ